MTKFVETHANQRQKYEKAKGEDLGDCIEDTNSMMRRLEDDEGIE